VAGLALRQAQSVAGLEPRVHEDARDRGARDPCSYLNTPLRRSKKEPPLPL
jgi:hypothetical protein